MRAYLAEANADNKPSGLSFFEGEWELARKKLTAQFEDIEAHRDREAYKDEHPELDVEADLKRRERRAHQAG